MSNSGLTDEHTLVDQRTQQKFQAIFANRVGEIQNIITRPKQWRYVSTEDNPGYHFTRGMAASALACNDQWWQGPEFLQMDEEEWPQNHFHMSKDLVTE